MVARVLPGLPTHPYTRSTRGTAAVPRIVVPVSQTKSAVMPIALDALALRSALTRVRLIIDRHAAALTRLDAVLGDGDHGDNLSIGFRAEMK